MKLLVSLSWLITVITARNLIDPTTPAAAYNTTSFSSTHPGVFELQWSDEFNTPGKDFSASANDPVWTADDLWKITTNDMVYYKSDHVTTTNGSLVITCDRTQTIQYCPYTSGMITTWNKLCFTGGIIEFSMKLPRDGWKHNGWWPAAWMMGNLGRVGYSKSTGRDGKAVWPWSYDSCDEASKYQLISACNASAGAGLNPHQGRGAPEIDILEPRLGGAPHKAYPSPSNPDPSQPTLIQTYHFDPKNPKGVPYTQGVRKANSTQEYNFNGDGYHDYIGCISPIDESFYTEFHTYRLEWYPQGSINWYVDDAFSFTLDQSALGPASGTGGYGVKSRLIPVEPMYFILNLDLSAIWGQPSPLLEFPGNIEIDWVRLYQQPSKKQMSCDPPTFPTKKYIESLPQIYQQWQHCPPYPAGVCGGN